MARTRSPKPKGPSPSPRTVKRRPDQSLTDAVPKAHLELIAGVIIQWSRLDGVIQELIWKLLKLDIEDGRVVTCLNDISVNISILRTLFRRKLPKAVADAFLLRLNQLTPLMEARNLVAHGLWATVMPEGDPGVLSLRKRTPEVGQIVWSGFSADYLRKLIKAIDDEKTVWKNLVGSQSTSPETPPSPPPQQ
jgi:hypothetical protein